jgi:hypothetical protein
MPAVIRRKGGGGNQGEVMKGWRVNKKVSKDFFFEKKKQKTLWAASRALGGATGSRRGPEVFLVTFFSKKVTASL